MELCTIPTKVITGVNTRWSYANVWDPKSINGGAPKYSVSLIIPKSDTATVAKIKSAIQAAYEEGQSKLKGNGKSVPALSAIKTPLRDGDLERPDDEAYKNAYFINANSVTVIWKDRMMKLTRTPTSSMPTAQRLPASWMQTDSRSWNVPKSTPACMAEPASTCTPSTAMATRVSPAV